MKQKLHKGFLIFTAVLSVCLMFTACPKEVPVEKTDSYTISNLEGNFSTENNIIVIDGNINKDNWALATIDFSKYAGKTITADLTVKMKVHDTTGAENTIRWQINTNSTYPTVIEEKFKSDEIKTVSQVKEIDLSTSPVFYLSSYELELQNLTITIYEMKLTVKYMSTGTADSISWLEANSLKEAYSPYFDKIGFACEYGFGSGELTKKSVQQGLALHANTTTMGNDFKPQFIFAWWGNPPSTNGTFTASNGQTIKVPSLNGISNLGKILSICKENNLQMRGHVLVWHSQTDDNFFAENYSAVYDNTDTKAHITNMVSKEVMQARQEWYIKTVLEYVNTWEAENNNGNHIIYAWDVVNEAAADDASGSKFLRGSTDGTKDKAPDKSGSRWYQLYGSEQFIVDAFRFANAYAPQDVELCYNDYNEYASGKLQGIKKIITAIQNGDAQTVNGKSVKPRIDVMGMQSHINTTWPGVQSYEAAVKEYVAMGLNVHVTELDVANSSSPSDNGLKTIYKEYFKMFIKNRKTAEKKGITSVTLWGIDDSGTWLKNQYPGTSQYPLLFNNYKCKPAFYGVLEAAE